MSYILDAIIILIILITTIISAKKGFVHTLIKVVGFVASIVVALTLSSPLATLTYDIIIEPVVINTAKSAVNDTTSTAENAVDTVWKKMPTFVTENRFLQLSKDNITDDIQTKSENNSEKMAQNISDTLVAPVTIKLLSALYSAILVIALLFVVKFLAKYLNKLFNFSVVGKLNKTLGGILGIVEGLAISIIFCLIISLILSFTKDGFLIFTYNSINESYLFKLLIGFSPFL